MITKPSIDFSYWWSLILFKTGILSILIQMTSCNLQVKTEGDLMETEKDGLINTFDNEGFLKTSINYKKGVKQGKSSLYYDKSKQVLLEMTYNKGMRVDTAYKYYENGKIYSKTPYKKDLVNGVIQIYYRDGALKAQIPYYVNHLGLGLKEYKPDGELRKLPEIEIEKGMYRNSKTLFLSIEKCKQANFYIGILAGNEYFIEGSKDYTILPQIENKGYYKISENSPLKLNIICKCFTESNFPYLIVKSIDLK